MQSQITVIPSPSILPGRVLVVQAQKATFDGPITDPWQNFALQDGAFVMMSQKDKETMDRRLAGANGLKGKLVSDVTFIKDQRN